MFMQVFTVYTMSLLFLKSDLPNNPYEVSGIIVYIDRETLRGPQDHLQDSTSHWKDSQYSTY